MNIYIKRASILLEKLKKAKEYDPIMLTRLENLLKEAEKKDKESDLINLIEEKHQKEFEELVFIEGVKQNLEVVARRLGKSPRSIYRNLNQLKFTTKEMQEINQIINGNKDDYL